MSELKDLIEQYRKKLSAPQTGTDYSMLYADAAEALAAAQDAAYKSRVAELEAEMPKIQGKYDDARSNAYQNAKRSAVQNNEALAALGLAGNLQDAAKSGVSETSRIATENQLRKNLNELNLSQLDAEQEVQKQIGDAGLNREQAMAGIMDDYSRQMAEYQQQMEENRQSQLEYELKQQQLEEEKRQSAISNALKELNAFGRIMTQESADALGIPIGTLSYAAQAAADKAAKSGGRRGRKSKTSKKYNQVLEKAQEYLSIPTDTYYASYNAALHGINVSALPAYQAREYLKSQVSSKKITEKQAQQIRSALGI